VHESINTVAAAVLEVSVSDDGGLKVHRAVMAVDCGTVVNPDIVKAQVESSVIFGLSAAMKQQVTFKAGRVEQSNFHDYPALRMNESPAIETYMVPSDAPPSGIGEPALPVVAPALANAVFALTGQRLRSLPLKLPTPG
jgi:isoquinoline 1-oxidoreductase beta subunit